uniref:MIER family member 2 n=1 Tax=Leptobrachium leishanense TaxID=445787 RepID=A0A8C5LTS3_9ANUR
MCEDEDSDFSYHEMLSFYGYHNSDPYSDHESESKGSDPEQSCEHVDLEQHAEETSSQRDEMPSGSPSLSPCLADSPEDWVSKPVLEEEKKIIESQAEIPCLRYSPAEEREFEEKDHLLWDPDILPETEVESFLNQAAGYNIRNTHGRKRERRNVNDNEQALYELVKCNFNAEEALRRLYFNVKAVKGGLLGWSDDERRNFEQGFRIYGKNFHLIQANKVRTRSVGECVQYYYSWKKSKRFRLFEKSRQGKRKQGIPPSLECEYDALTSENPSSLQESNCCGQNFGCSGMQSTSNKDQCTCRLSPLSGPGSEDNQEASSVNSDLHNLDFPTEDLPVMSDLMGLDLPLSTFSVTNVALADFLITPSRLCTTPLAP